MLTSYLLRGNQYSSALLPYELFKKIQQFFFSQQMCVKVTGNFRHACGASENSKPVERCPFTKSDVCVGCGVYRDLSKKLDLND